MKEKIANYITSEFYSGENMQLATDEDLLNAGLIDSMGLMKIIQFIEEEFDFKVGPEDMTIEHFISVDAMADYIATKK